MVADVGGDPCPHPIVQLCCFINEIVQSSCYIAQTRAPNFNVCFFPASARAMAARGKGGVRQCVLCALQRPQKAAPRLCSRSLICCAGLQPSPKVVLACCLGFAILSIVNNMCLGWVGRAQLCRAGLLMALRNLLLRYLRPMVVSRWCY